MPAVSERQRRLMAMAMRLKRGELSRPSETVKKVAEGMSEKKLRHFASVAGTPIRHHKKRKEL